MSRLAAIQEDVKSTLGQATIDVDEAATVLSALGKVGLASSLRVHWGLYLMRLSSAAHSQQFHGADVSTSEQ
eukprot:2138425-Pyramimonas_sp.AAC.1